MSETKPAVFTPGPWRVVAHGAGQFHIIESANRQTSLEDPRLALAAVDADADLIAAAPDLYASLAAIVEEGFGSTYPPARGLHDAASLALAKARGEG